MAGSPFFARIESDVIAIVAAIPPGRVATFADIGAHLDVMPRHVAYILTMLDDAERMALPWHRVVAKDGKLLVSETSAWPSPQAARLMDEGVDVLREGRIADLAAVHIAVDALESGVPRQVRPADAPKATSRGSRGRRKS